MTKNEIVKLFNSTTTSATRFVFHFRPPLYCGKIAYALDKHKLGDKNFTENVIEFLCKISLTHTISDIDYYDDVVYSDIHVFDIWTESSFDTNIDCDVLDAILNNIRGVRTNGI